MEQKILKSCYNIVKNKYCNNFSIPKNVSFIIADLELNNPAKVEDTKTDNPKIYVSRDLIKLCVNEAINNDTSKYNISILVHALHHELCHIEIDKNNPIISKYSDNYKYITDDNRGKFLLCVFLQEYIACYLSYKTITNAIVQKNSNTFISIDLNLNNTGDYIKFVKQSAYFLGETKIQGEELRKYILDNMKNLYIKDLLIDFDAIGEKLAKKYKNITDVDIENNQYTFSTSYFMYK